MSEAQDLCKETVKVACTGLAALSFGEQILGKEMWPPPHEPPELWKQHWLIVWTKLGWVNTDLGWSWRREEGTECPCVQEREFERGNAGSAWGISWLPAGEVTACVPPFPSNPVCCHPPLLCFV